MIIIKISTKDHIGTDLMNKIREKLKYEGIVINLLEYDDTHMCMELISCIEDHIPSTYLNLGGVNLMKNNDSIRRILGNTLITKAGSFNIFEYLGNSRIDGNPIFKLSDNSVRKHRNKIINDLGI